MDDICICCPKCGKKAIYHQPFKFVGKRDKPNGSNVYSMGGHYVIERYPTILPWKLPKHRTEAERHKYEQGVVKCAACYFVGLHKLNWPHEAFYQWTIRGKRLWAFTEAHAWAILEYLGGTTRNRADYPEFAYWLKRIPRHFITAKVRDEVVKAISATLK